MSNSLYHYVGYYFKCEKSEMTNPYLIFPAGDFRRAYDENGSDDINENHIFICNTSAIGGHLLLSDDGISGFRNLPDRMFPKEFQAALAKLQTLYPKVDIYFGVVSHFG